MYGYRKLRQIQHEAFPVSQLLSGTCYAIEEVVNPGYRCRINETTYFAPILTRSGSSDYVVDGVPCRIEPGSLLLLPPGISFSEHVPGPDPIHNIYLMLEGPVAKDWAAQVKGEKPFLYVCQVSTLLAKALESIVRTIHGDSIQHPWQVVADLCRLGQLLQEVLTQSLAGKAMAVQLERLLQQDPSAHWTVAAIARSFGMSESSFAHNFRIEVGQSPAAFVRRQRCHLARTLLEEGHSVSETSEQLGFTNPYHFSRVFKSVTGQTPSSIKAHRLPLHRF